MRILFSLTILLVSAGVSLQAVVNATLARALGGPLGGGVVAALVSFLVGTALLAILVTSLRQLPSLADAAAAPWWAWTGGAFGAAYVASVAALVPRLGVAPLVCLGIAGQSVAALLIDQYGVGGVPVQPITWLRAAGVLLTLAGGAMVRFL